MQSGVATSGSPNPTTRAPPGSYQSRWRRRWVRITRTFALNPQNPATRTLSPGSANVASRPIQCSAFFASSSSITRPSETSIDGVRTRRADVCSFVIEVDRSTGSTGSLVRSSALATVRALSRVATFGAGAERVKGRTRSGHHHASGQILRCRHEPWQRSANRQATARLAFGVPHAL